MDQTSHRALGITGAVLLSALALGGCATKAFVRDQAAVVDQRVTGVDTRLNGTDKTANEALQRANAAGKLAEGKFVYSTVLSDDSVKFPLRSAKLSAEDETRLMDLAQKLKADNKNVYLEIQGHTDSKETDKMRLGQQRAEAVRQFMYKQGVALSRMATISYADQQPIAPNSTRAGRAQNRCAVVVVLA